jgi:uncharacterized membrane protein YphA (DoxX/SURF4 family)
MTLSTLLINIGIAAVILSAVLYFAYKSRIKSLLMTLIQNFCGVLFVFSGWVKAVDPLGTAYKMEQYFDEFYSTFEATWFGFLAPVFPYFSKHAIWFALIMIVFEIVLGVMLIIGARQKFASWAFLLLVAFFTVLTGFTYLTGYVPAEANFFQFGSWAEYNANNMKVTDCGCFGDFIKLEPKVSFFKDVFLLVPALFFVWKNRDMHQLFSVPVRNGIVGLSVSVLVVYCFSNYVWDLPQKDFRPFKKGADVRTIREAEQDAMAAVQITDWKLENKETGETLTVSNAEYMGNLSAYMGKYSVLEQIKGEPSIKPTKISDFQITDLDGYDITDDILYSEQPYFLVVNYMLKGDPKVMTRIVRDSVFSIDTVSIFDTGTLELDTQYTVRSFDELIETEEEYIDQNWSTSYLKKHTDVLKPFTDAAKADGYTVMMAIGKSDPDAIGQFDEATGLGIQYGMADDILLKTIVRSNPGVVLWQDGKILDKWHIKKLPDYAEVKKLYLEGQ